MANITKLTPEKKEDFLTYLAKIGKVSTSAKLIGLSRQTLYAEKHEDEEFSKAWDEAAKKGLVVLVNQMEEEAYRRAVKGVTREKYYMGSVCGQEKHYSDTLLMFLLKARKPEVYSEKVVQELTGKDGSAITIQVKPVDYRAAIAPLVGEPGGSS